MKRLVLLLLIFAITISLNGCHGEGASKTDSRGAHQESTSSESSDDLSYDKEGILYGDILNELLKDYGTIYWNVDEGFYVLKPRNTYRQAILGLVADPFDETYMKYWDGVAEIIKLVTKEFPSAICVSNPVNANNYLLIVIIGEIAYTVF